MRQLHTTSRPHRTLLVLQLPLLLLLQLHWLQAVMVGVGSMHLASISHSRRALREGLGADPASTPYQRQMELQQSQKHRQDRLVQQQPHGQ